MPSMAPRPAWQHKDLNMTATAPTIASPRPGYSHGAAIPLKTARWIHARQVSGVMALPNGPNDQSGNRLRLFAASAETLDIHCAWGLILTTPSGKAPSCITLDLQIARELDAICAWEAANA